MNNCIRLYFPDMVEGSAHALLPGQWNGYRQHEKSITLDGASTVLKTVADPDGYYLPLCYQPPITDGDASWCPNGAGELSATGYAAKLASIDLTGSGNMTAEAALLVSAILSLTGSGDMALDGGGDANATLSLSGAGDMDIDGMGFGDAVLALSGLGGLDLDAMGYANATIDIVVTGTGLTTANVGQAVWSALAASNNNPNTMGELLNAAGGGSSPEIIAEAVMAALAEGDIDVRSVLRRMLALASGEGSMPSGPGTFTMKSQDGTKDRIVGEIDEDGNRTITSTDDT